MPLPFPLSKQDSEPILPIAITPIVSSAATSSGASVATVATSMPLETEEIHAPVDLRALKHAIDLEAQPELKSGPGNQPRLARLPTWISFWLGYRKTTPPPEKNYVVWIWSFIGAFSCISALQGLFGNVPVFVEKGVPSIGATAILLYGAIESPLSQPRPVVLGHLVGAITGVCITKLFLLLPTPERYEELSWLAGSLCCALALVFMQMTGTMHPPAGATALLAAISPDIRQVGWFYIPVVLLAATIALVIALVTNNLQRRYPTFWWTPPPTIAPSFFPTLELSRTLTKTMSWTSKNKTLNSVRNSFRSGRKRSKKNSGPAVPTADQDWHYALKNHSSIFKTGRAGSIRVARSGSRSRDSSRAPPDRRSKGAGTLGHLDVDTSKVASPASSHSPTPMFLSPAPSTPISRVQSSDDVHVEFQVQPMHHHHHHRTGPHQQRHSHIHHPQHNAHHANHLRYLAMKREGTMPPTATGSAMATPAESTAVSRTASVEGLSAMNSPGHHHQKHVRLVDFADPSQQKQHAQQLMEAVTSIVKEREEQGAEGIGSPDKDDSQWEDIDGQVEEEDLGEAPNHLTFRRNSKRGDESA